MPRNRAMEIPIPFADGENESEVTVSISMGEARGTNERLLDFAAQLENAGYRTDLHWSSSGGDSKFPICETRIVEPGLPDVKLSVYGAFVELPDIKMPDVAETLREQAKRLAASDVDDDERETDGKF